MANKGPINYYVVDAFTDSAFKGNPAAVCLLEEDKDDQWLQALASEFHPVTCFLTPITHNITNGASCWFRLRYFSPVHSEVKLCGHATLAAAHTLFKSGLVNSNIVEFSTLSGILSAKKVFKQANGSITSNGDSQDSSNGDSQDSYFIELNLPADPSSESISVDAELISEALGGASAIDLRRTANIDNLLVVLPSGIDVANLQPNFDVIKKCPGSFGVTVTGIAPPESGFDFYSRFFSPNFGVNEDQVCGSAHCGIATYWCEKMGKTDFVAYQASQRGGILDIHLDEQNQRVLLRGKAITVMEGTILV